MKPPRKNSRRPRWSAPTTRSRILDQLKSALVDKFVPAAREEPCRCDDCRLSRALDVTPDARVLQVQSAAYARLLELADALDWSDNELTNFTMRLFRKPPPLLREVEASAVIAHLEQGVRNTVP